MTLAVSLSFLTWILLNSPAGPAASCRARRSWPDRRCGHQTPSLDHREGRRTEARLRALMRLASPRSCSTTFCSRLRFPFMGIATRIIWLIWTVKLLWHVGVPRHHTLSAADSFNATAVGAGALVSDFAAGLPSETRS